MGSAASGLALAGPQMLTWIKGMKLATIAQRAFNLSMKLNPIGLVVTALALAAAGIYKFRKEILGFLSGAWDTLKGAVESAKGWLGPLGKLFGDTSEEVANLSDELAGHSLTTAFDEAGARADVFSGTVELIPPVLDETEQSADKLNVTLALLAAGTGGAAAQAMNLVAAMIQTNDQLEEGDEEFSNVQIGAAVAGAAFHAMGESMDGAAGTILSAAGTLATAFATGGPLGVALAGIGLLMELGGPSKAELAARDAFGAWHKGVVGELGKTKRFIEEVQRAVADGWDQTLAESRAGFIIWGQAAGKTYDEAFADYARYEKAVRDGNTAIIAQIEDEYAAYRKLAEMMDQVYDTAVSAYDRAKAAGISAYDEVFQAAIESGKGQEEATAQALAAQEAAIAELLAAEKEKYVFLAVREAVLEAIRSGNAAGAAEAGRKAARETREAWDTAMDVIAEADQVATDAMTDNSTVRADHAIAESDRMSTIGSVTRSHRIFPESGSPRR